MMVEPAGIEPASGSVRFGFHSRRNLSRPHESLKRPENPGVNRVLRLKASVWRN